jgi:Domain of unknown function (DUF1854)
MNLPQPALGTFSRDDQERLVIVGPSGDEVLVRLVPLFPLTNPEGPFVVLGHEDREIAYYSSMDQVADPGARELLREALRLHLFLPQIQSIFRVSTFDFPSVWGVRTDRGMTELHLSSEDCFRRLGRYSLLIREQSGLEFRVADWNSLDKRTRKILERFL